MSNIPHLQYALQKKRQERIDHHSKCGALIRALSDLLLPPSAQRLEDLRMKEIRALQRDLDDSWEAYLAANDAIRELERELA